MIYSDFDTFCDSEMNRIRFKSPTKRSFTFGWKPQNFASVNENGPILRDRSQTLVGGGGWCKKGVLKIFEPCKGGLEKNTTNFPVKIEFSCFSMGLTRNFFMAKEKKKKKKGGGVRWHFLRSGAGRSPTNFAIFFFFCIRGPLTSVCERSFKDISCIETETMFRDFLRKATH